VDCDSHFGDVSDSLSECPAGDKVVVVDGLWNCYCCYWVSHYLHCAFDHCQSSCNLVAAAAAETMKTCSYDACQTFAVEKMMMMTAVMSHNKHLVGVFAVARLTLCLHYYWCYFHYYSNKAVAVDAFERRLQLPWTKTILMWVVVVACNLMMMMNWKADEAETFDHLELLDIAFDYFHCSVALKPN
jgi:hypothetical protein